MGLKDCLLSGYNLVIGPHIRKQLAFLRDKAPESFKQRRLDDLGCGDGKITVLFKEILQPEKLRGYDVSPHLVRLARKRGIDAEVRNIEAEMPRGELGVMWGVLHHLNDRPSCLKKLKENYRLILIREPLKGGSYKWLELGDPMSKEDLEHLIKENLPGAQIAYCDNNALVFYESASRE